MNIFLPIMVNTFPNRHRKWGLYNFGPIKKKGQDCEV